MRSSIIQIQLEEKELTKAHKLAKAWGFSSVEEILEAFIKQLSVPVHKAEPISLSDKAKKRFKKIDEDFRNDKNTHIAKGVDDFFAQLDA